MALMLSLLSPAIILIGFVSFVVIYLVRNSKTRSEFSKLPQPAGKLPVVGHSLLLLKRGVDITESSFEAFYKYAVEYHEFGLYAFALAFQPTVHIFSAEHFEKLMTSNTHINKSTSYSPLRPWLGTGLIVSGGDKWHKDRKSLTPAFHFKIMDEFNPLINKHARVLCDKIKTTLNMEVTNCVATLSACALDTICETSMGVDMKTQTCESDENSFSTSFIEFNKLATKRALNSLLSQNERLYAMTPDGRRSKRLIKNMHDFTGGIVRQRKKEVESTIRTGVGEGKRKLKSLLDLMLDIHLNDNSLNLQDIQFQLDNFAFAGHDTVSNAISFVLVCLANYTDVQHRVRAEITEVIGDGATEISTDHLSKFPYLEMVIKESMRVYPPVPFTGRHLHENLTLGDHVIPKGTDIWMNYFALNRNPTHWPEPNKFDPERFSPENSTGRHPFAFVPFSAGQRNCIGQRYAKTFMKIVIAQIVTQFEIIPVTTIGDLTLSFEITIKTMKPIQLKFKSLTV
ncbi:cytochrome P450 4V2-like [Bradysia coprophila]|uniref:cytochrome P450 4V2-like n=1 Tax=Bradysia coprophila TaxID=38358 RepID=UPI00187D837A|nr:cytochrome P450 4V2-like [Bradysia coprophila]